MILGLTPLAVIVLLVPVAPLGQAETLVVLPYLALVAADHLAPADVALFSAHASDDSIVFLVVLFALDRLRTRSLAFFNRLGLLLCLWFRLGLCDGLVEGVGVLGVVALVCAA